MQRIATGFTTGLLTVILLAGGVTSFSACREEGPAERAGRAIDEATSDAADSAKDMMDDAGDKVDEAVDTAKQKMDEATGTD